jgi:hypothetical protein
MHNQLLIIFLILLFGLILFQFLGTGRIEGFNNSTETLNFTASDGSKAVVTADKNTATVTKPDGSNISYTQNGSKEGKYGTSYIYSGSDGSSAIITTGNTGTSTFITKNEDGSNQLTYTQTTNSDNKSSSVSSADKDFSGTDYDNYNHYDQSSYPTIFYGPNGGTARIINTQGNDTIVITNKNGTTTIYYIDRNSDPSIKIYYGPNGGSAKIIEAKGKKAIELTGPDGNKVIYYSDNIYAYSNDDSTINQYNPVSVPSSSADYSSAFTNPMQINATSINGPSGSVASTYDSSAYYNSLPKGIPKSMIPAGQEDLYILKSEVVPPVCPAPTVIKVPDASFDVTKCPPCEPCGRCPEPSFDCKKVPNYNSFNPDTMPIPVLNDFSTFGM